MKNEHPAGSPWEIPASWAWECLGSLGDWCGGGTPSKARPEFWEGGTVPWVSPKDMKRFLIDGSEDKITPEAVKGSSAKLVKAGSVLCVMRSGILRHTFPVAVTTVEVTLNQDMRALTPRLSLDPIYIAYYLQFTGRTVLETSSKGGTTVNSVEAARLDRHPVPLPDIDVQRRIVGRIDELFAEIDDGEAALARARSDLATWRRSLLKAAVTGDLTADWRAANPSTETGADLLARILTERRALWEAEPKNKGKRYAEPEPPETETLSVLPQSWAWTTVDALLESGIQNGLYLPQTAYGQGVPIMRIDDFQCASARPSAALRSVSVSQDLAEIYSLRPGDYVINRVNSLTHLAKSFLVNDTHVPSLFESNMMRMTPSESVNGRYFELYLSSDIGRSSLCRNAKAAVNQASVNQADVSATVVPLPPLSEQTAIVQAFSNGLDFAGEPLAGLEAASAILRQSILAAAFRGKLVT